MLKLTYKSNGNTVGRLFVKQKMENQKIKLMRKTKLTDKQISVIVGTLLGDGYLDKTTMGYSLRLHHGKSQEEYVLWKYNILKNIVNSQPKTYKTRENTIKMYFRTVSHPYFLSLRKLFYRNGKKIFPGKFLEKIFDPLILATWLMDDGTNELGTSKCVKINSQSFSHKEHETICGVLKKKFDLDANVNKDRQYFRIRFYQRSMPRLIKIVRPYILPSMLYKFSP